jgi:hypothetical protein
MSFEGTGATITFGTTGVSLEANSIQSQGIEWASIEDTDLGNTTAKSFLRGDLYDPGTITVGFNWTSDLDDLLSSSDSETITITYPNTDSSTEASDGFIQSIDPSTLEVDTLATGTLTVKRTGPITYTDAPA